VSRSVCGCCVWMFGGGQRGAGLGRWGCSRNAQQSHMCVHALFVAMCAPTPKATLMPRPLRHTLPPCAATAAAAAAMSRLPSAVSLLLLLLPAIAATSHPLLLLPPPIAAHPSPPLLPVCRCLFLTAGAGSEPSLMQARVGRHGHKATHTAAAIADTGA
jgi:hypothetical protein